MSKCKGCKDNTQDNKEILPDGRMVIKCLEVSNKCFTDEEVHAIQENRSAAFSLRALPKSLNNNSNKHYDQIVMHSNK